MSTITDTPTATLATPDLADELTAGRPYPVRDWQQPLDSLSARELLADIRAWWLEAADGYLSLAESAHRAGDHDGYAEAMHDCRTALAAAKHYAPQEV